MNRPRWISWRSAYLALLALTMVVAIVRSVVGRSDLAVFVRGSARLLSGQYVTINEVHNFTYPPFFALVMTPFTWMPLSVARVVWAVMSFILFLLIMRVIAAIVFSTSPFSRFAVFDEASSSTRYRILSVTLLICLQVSLAVFQNQQFDVLVFFLAMCGVGAILKNRPWVGGIALASAAAIKVTPVLFLPYLLVKRNYRAAAAMIVAGIVLSFLPDLLCSGPEPGKLYLVDWFAKIVLHHSSLAAYIEPGYVASLAPGGGTNELNQSLGILFHRLFAADSDSPIHLFDLPTGAIQVIRLAAFTGLFIPLLLLGTWKTSHGESTKTTLALEMSAIFPLMLLFSPMSSKAHFVSLLMPTALIVAFYQLNPTPRFRTFLLAVFLVAISGRDILGGWLASIAYHAGAITWVTIAIYGATLWVLKNVMEREP